MGCSSNKVIEYNKKHNSEKSEQNIKKDKQKEKGEENDNKNLKSISKDLENKMPQKKENIKKDLKAIKDNKEKEENRDKTKSEEKKQIEKIGSILLKIKSKYTFNNITDYIEDKMLMLKLVKYSKKLQYKLNYEFIMYQHCYFMKIQMMPQYYFYNHIKCGDNLKKGLEEDLKMNQIDAKVYETFVKNYWKIIELNKDLIKEGYGYPIKISSPFINILSKEKHFDKYMLMQTIDDNLDNNLINFFKNLNQMNLVYPEIFLEISSNHANNLISYNINFDKIKVLKINNQVPCDIFKDIFSFFKIYDNITYMDLSCAKDYKTNSFEILNNFKSLKFLSLSRFKFENPFILKLYNLIELKINDCENIGFEENNNFNTEKLIIKDSKIIKPKSFIKFSKLENYEINNKEIISYLFDPLFVNKVKVIKCSSDDFLKLENIYLEELTLDSHKDETDIQIFEKILRYKNLKFVNFSTNLTEEQIAKINGKNDSVTTLYVVKDKAQGQMFNLQNKFPNVKLFSLSSGGFESKDIEVIENSNCKINAIYLNNLSNVKIYCKSYASLESLSVTLMKMANYNNIFPFNIANNKINFSSMTTFYFNCFNNVNIDTELLNKLDNIFDCMPNLNNVSLNIFSNYINENYYLKLLKKILSKNKLKSLVYSVLTKNTNSSILTKNELEQMFPNLKIGNIITLFIKKFA